MQRDKIKDVFTPESLNQGSCFCILLLLILHCNFVSTKEVCMISLYVRKVFSHCKWTLHGALWPVWETQRLPLLIGPDFSALVQLCFCWHQVCCLCSDWPSHNSVAGNIQSYSSKRVNMIWHCSADYTHAYASMWYPYIVDISGICCWFNVVWVY